jgi:uncharacterized membrane protein
MSHARPRWTEQQVEESVGNLLRGGVIVAAVVVLLGGLVYLIRHGTDVPDYRVFHGVPDNLRSVHGIVLDTLAGRSRGVIQFGLLLLVATPVARVVFAMVAFARQHDYMYVIVSLIVLIVLLYSLTGGTL